MIKIGKGVSNENMGCVCCRKQTRSYATFCEENGVKISIPVCINCHNYLEENIEDAIKTHLLGIKQSIRLL